MWAGPKPSVIPKASGWLRGVRSRWIVIWDNHLVDGVDLFGTSKSIFSTNLVQALDLFSISHWGSWPLLVKHVLATRNHQILALLFCSEFKAKYSQHWELSQSTLLCDFLSPDHFDSAIILSKQNHILWRGSCKSEAFVDYEGCFRSDDTQPANEITNLRPGVCSVPHLHSFAFKHGVQHHSFLPHLNTPQQIIVNVGGLTGFTYIPFYDHLGAWH